MSSRICRWSASLIRNSESNSFVIFKNLQNTWGIRYLSNGFPSYATDGAGCPCAYRTPANALRALARLRPDVSPDIEIYPF